ncbi:GbsR/MarR family transcriptional regulator [Microbacterium rhizophilus]|uniref:GbsR/MarR family transcriptional regulator n=1 Tax=Microbacterium rhizophilus TaxID=3138934 RepID=UPI0031E597F7
MTQDDPREARVTEAAERSAAVLAALGFPTMPARILVALLSSESGSLTAAELGRILGVSAAAVSGGVRYLEMIAVVHRVSDPGHRRRRWQIAEDWYNGMTSQSGVYDRGAESLEQLAAVLDPGGAAHARTADSAGFLRFVGRRVPALLQEWKEERDRS